MDEREATRQRYLKFANEEVRYRSTSYERLCVQIAEDGGMITFLNGLPVEKRQPNLLLGAVRYLSESVLSWTDFRDFVNESQDRLRAVMLERSTQTNEPARCATLLPLLARLQGPLALIEVGASAGLCLLPDFYRYDFGGVSVEGAHSTSASPLLRCKLTGNGDRKLECPDIVWRAGLDLNPLDVTKSADAKWLEALVWPEQTERLENLRAATRVAATCRPEIRRGDLRKDLLGLAAEAPPDATLVIFHTAVLGYVPSKFDREHFAKDARKAGRHWISNEWSRVFPPLQPSLQSDSTANFLLMLDGEPMGWADPHGAALDLL